MNYGNFLLFIFFTLRTDVTDGEEDDEIDYVFALRKVKKITEETNAHMRYLKSSNICSFNDVELTRVCKLALANSLLQKYGFDFNDIVPVGEPKVYRLELSFKADEFVQACKCPSHPPVYLTDKHKNQRKKKKIYRSLIKFRKAKRRKMNQKSLRKMDQKSLTIGVTLLVDKTVGVDGKLKRMLSGKRPSRFSRKELSKMEENIIANCI